MAKRPIGMVLAAAVMILALAAACGGPEEKKVKFFNRALELFEKGDYVKARLEVKNALQIDPKYAEGYQLLGRIEQKTANLKEAFGAFGKAVELKPELSLSQIEMGKMLLMGGAADKAMERAEAVLAKEPENVDALILKGSVLLVKKQPDGAIAVFEGLRTRGVKNPEVYMALANAHAQKKNAAQAEKMLQEGVAANPDSVPLRLVLAKFFLDGLKPDKAEAELQQVIRLEPGNPRHRIILAGLYWDQGRQAVAIDLLTEMVAADPAKEELREAAARFYMAKRQPFEAAKVLEAGIEKNPQSIRPRLLLGEVYLSMNRAPQAVEVLEANLKLSKDPADPGIIQTKNALAKVHLRMRQTAKAEAYVNEVLQASPKSIEGHFTRGDILLSRGDGGGAVVEFRTVLGEQPQYLPAYVRLASAHVLNKEPELAVNTLQNALKLDPNYKPALQALARIHAINKNHGEAEQNLRRIVEIDPNDIGARAELGDFYAELKRYPEAEAADREITKRAAQNPLGYIKLARLYRSQGKDKEALKELEEGYRQNQTSAQLLTELVQAYARQKKHAAAVALCKKRIDDNPRDVFAYNLLGLVFTDLKNYREAEDSLKKAIEMQPLWPVPHINLANLYLVQGRKKDAIDKFESAIRINPKDGSAYLALAMVYERDRDYRGAIQVYERALAADPGFWFAANNLAFLLGESSGRKEDLARAKSLAEEALKVRPNDPGILDTLGWVHYRMGDLNQARSLLEQALGAAPEADVMNYHLGAVLLKQGQKDEALEKLKKALGDDGDFPGRNDAEKLLKELS